MDTASRQFTIVDAHNDLALAVGQPDLLGLRASLHERWIPELKRGGIAVQIAAIYVSPEIPEAALRTSLLLLQRLWDEVEATRSQAAICLNGEDIDQALGAGKIAFVLSLEGCGQVGSNVALIRTFHRLGVRAASLTHHGRTGLADGSGETGTGGRLTKAGIDVVREMQRLGILVDVSHLSAAGVEHVIELSTRPVIASHSAARALYDHHRNLDDPQLRRIAGLGGMVGLALHPGITGPPATIDRIVDHILHIAAVAGIEYVGIGSDFVYDLFRDLYSPDANLTVEGIDGWGVVEGLARPSDFPRLIEKMLQRGITETEARQIMGENFMRLFRQELGVSSASPS